MKKLLAVPKAFFVTIILQGLVGTALCDDEDQLITSTGSTAQNSNNFTAPLSLSDSSSSHITDNENDIEAIIAAGELRQVEVGNNLSEQLLPVRKDKFFHKDSSIFDEYMKGVDFSIIPGYRVEDDFENWVPPEDIQRELPTYISGFDYENRPIWVVEYGKYNYTKYATGGKIRQALFHKYYRYLSYVNLKSHALKSTPERPVNQHALIVDFEGLTPDHILNPKALQLQLRWIRNYRRYAVKYFSKIVCINVNMLSETLFNFVKTMVVSLLDRLEIYGTDKTRWGPKLVKIFPQDQIPEWYGGSKGFKPLCVLG